MTNHGSWQKNLAFGGIFLSFLFIAHLYAVRPVPGEPEVFVESTAPGVPVAPVDPAPRPETQETVSVQPPAPPPAMPTERTAQLQRAFNQGGVLLEDTASPVSRLWDTLIVADQLQSRGYRVVSATGTVLGEVALLTGIQVDPYAALLAEATGTISPTRTLREGARGSRALFLYNDLEKTENLRIVVQAGAREAYALSLPTAYQWLVDAALSSF